MQVPEHPFIIRERKVTAWADPRTMFDNNDSNLNQNGLKTKTNKMTNILTKFRRNSPELVRFETDPNKNRQDSGSSQKLTKCSFCYGTKTTFIDYTSKTSLHGVKYIGDKDSTLFERIFWIVAFWIGVGLAGYYGSNIYDKWTTSPVIVSINPTYTKINSIPFPAITFCNLNQAKKKEADIIMNSQNELEKRLLDDICNGNSSFNQNETAQEEVGNWDNVQKFMVKIGQSCTEMMKICKWKMKEYVCNDLINAALTDEGICCSFNKVHREFLFRNPKDLGDLNITYPFETVDWTPEAGYPPNTTINAVPYRAVGAGKHLGLTVVLDAAVDDYYCSSGVSTGFKVLLHSPVETPRIADYGFLIPAGYETRIAIQPNMLEAAPQIRSITIDKRQCYFSNERALRFYRTYTQRNCALECQANITLEECGCVPYFMPKSRSTRICGKYEEPCSNSAKEKMENEESGDCDCLPACYELSYDKHQSYATIDGTFEISDDMLKDVTPEYFRKNMAVIHFYYRDNQFTNFAKGELFGFTDFLSSIGGLLGLFLGFSFLSFIEIIYYMTIKVICSYYRGTLNRTVVVPEKVKFVYPFTK